MSLSLDAWLGIAGIVATIISILVGVWLYLKTEKRVSLSFAVYSTTLISNEPGNLPPQIQITFQGVSINDLRKANVIFWNSGGRSIRAIDIAALEPIGFSFPIGPQLLRSQIVKFSQVSNNVTLVNNAVTELDVTFDYLEPKQGFNLELLYTGPLPLNKPRGKIIDMGGPLDEVDTPGRDRSGPSLLAFLAVIPGFLVAVPLVQSATFSTYAAERGWPILLWAFMTMLPVFITELLIKRLRLRSRRSPPQDLRQ